MFTSELWHGKAASRYAIDQSIRFNEADSPYMQKTYSGDGSRTTWSFSFWTKLGKSPPYNTTRGNFLIAYNTTSGAQEDIRIEGSNQQLQWFTHDDGATSILADLKTTQYLRDHSAWYHILCVADRTNAVASERQRMYINGQRVTDFATETYPSKDAEGHVGKSADVHYIGSRGGNSSTRFDGYMAEINYLDGLAYDPSFFGEFNSSGIWVPKEYTGSYGTNGFKIDGRDASDLESGNGNDYATSGLASHDQVADSPTNNFPTFNPIYADSTGINNVTLANGNLQGTGTSGQFDHKTATFNLPQSGKWYFEYYLGGRYDGIGICIVGQEGSITGGYGFGALSTSQGFGFQDNVVYNSNSATVNFGIGNQNAGDILNCAFDVDNDKVFLGVNGTYYAADAGNDGNPSTGANPTVTTTFSLSTNDIILGFQLSSSSGSAYLNFGQEGTFAGNKTAGGNSDANGIGNFFNSVPSGYLALCTKNLGS